MATVDIRTPYRTRPIRFLEVWEEDGWKVKVYGISAVRERPDPALVDAAKRLASERLPRPARTDDRYGAAILIVHEGEDGQYVLVDWWTGENMLHQHVFGAEAGAVEGFRYLSPTGLCACVWELHVLHFERTAWIETVLANPDGPDLEAYLARRLEEDV